jgi:hypothetical protein
MAMKMLYDQSN